MMALQIVATLAIVGAIFWLGNLLLDVLAAAFMVGLGAVVRRWIVWRSRRAERFSAEAAMRYVRRAARSIIIGVMWLALPTLLAYTILPRLLFSTSINSAAHVKAAIDYRNKAAAIGNRIGAAGAVVIMQQSDYDAIMSYDSKALVEAEQANIADMNDNYPGFGDHFRDEFIQGLRIITSHENDTTSTDAFLQGQLLVDNFGHWYDAHFDAIRSRKR